MRPVRHIRNIWLTIPGLRGTCESELRAGQHRCSGPKVHTRPYKSSKMFSNIQNVITFCSVVTFKCRWQEVCCELNLLSFGEPWEMKPWWFVNNQEVNHWSEHNHKHRRTTQIQTRDLKARRTPHSHGVAYYDFTILGSSGQTQVHLQAHVHCILMTVRGGAITRHQCFHPEREEESFQEQSLQTSQSDHV